MDFNPYAPPSAAAELGVPPPQHDGQLASPGRRLAAKLLDALLFVAAASPGIVLVEGVGQRDAAIFIFMVPGILMLVQWGLIAASGQTLGKRWLGIRIVTQDDRPVGFLRGVLLREWVMKAGGTLAYGMPLLIDPVLVFGPKRMCLHDHLANTKVVMVSPRS